jgi:hypothetical protein
MPSTSDTNALDFFVQVYGFEVFRDLFFGKVRQACHDHLSLDIQTQGVPEAALPLSQAMYQ